jgi:hypothetical protein
LSRAKRHVSFICPEFFSNFGRNSENKRTQSFTILIYQSQKGAKFMSKVVIAQRKHLYVCDSQGRPLKLNKLGEPSKDGRLFSFAQVEAAKIFFGIKFAQDEAKKGSYIPMWLTRNEAVKYGGVEVAIITTDPNDNIFNEVAIFAGEQKFGMRIFNLITGKMKIPVKSTGKKQAGVHAVGRDEQPVTSPAIAHEENPDVMPEKSAIPTNVPQEEAKPSEAGTSSVMPEKLVSEWGKIPEFSIEELPENTDDIEIFDTGNLNEQMAPETPEVVGSSVPLRLAPQKADSVKAIHPVPQISVQPKSAPPEKTVSPVKAVKVVVAEKRRGKPDTGNFICLVCGDPLLPDEFDDGNLFYLIPLEGMEEEVIGRIMEAICYNSFHVVREPPFATEKEPSFISICSHREHRRAARLFSNAMEKYKDRFLQPASGKKAPKPKKVIRLIHPEPVEEPVWTDGDLQTVENDVTQIIDWIKDKMKAQEAPGQTTAGVEKVDKPKASDKPTVNAEEGKKPYKPGPYDRDREADLVEHRLREAEKQKREQEAAKRRSIA